MHLHDPQLVQLILKKMNLDYLINYMGYPRKQEQQKKNKILKILIMIYSNLLILYFFFFTNSMTQPALNANIRSELIMVSKRCAI
jgi:hypothetical protein